eukprot:2788917-Rhodomonas_salina.2
MLLTRRCAVLTSAMLLGIHYGVCGTDVGYTKKSNLRNRIPGASCTEIPVSCIGFRGASC